MAEPESSKTRSSMRADETVFPSKIYGVINIAQLTYGAADDDQWEFQTHQLPWALL